MLPTRERGLGRGRHGRGCNGPFRTRHSPTRHVRDRRRSRDRDSWLVPSSRSIILDESPIDDSPVVLASASNATGAAATASTSNGVATVAPSPTPAAAVATAVLAAPVMVIEGPANNDLSADPLCHRIMMVILDFQGKDSIKSSVIMSLLDMVIDQKNVMLAMAAENPLRGNLRIAIEQSIK